jgi:hypothetical protein
MKKNLGFVLIIAMVLLTGCTAGSNTFTNIPNADGNIAGFWIGLWHGLIAPVTFIISLFSKHVHFYEIHNNGGWYNFGFLLGLSIVFGSGGKGASRKHKC